MSKLKAMLFGDSQEYSEPAMALRASLFMAPLWLLGWDHGPYHLTREYPVTTRYRCLYEGTVRCGGDQHKRAKCQYCSAPLYTMEGQWGVFTWTGDGRYKAADAHRVYSSKTAADRFAAVHDYVTRWIPA